MQLISRIGSVLFACLQPRALTAFSGLCGGCLMAAWLRQLTALYGSSVEVRSAIAVVVIASVLVGLAVAQRRRLAPWLVLAGTVVLACWAAGTDWLLNGAWRITATIVTTPDWPSAERQFFSVLIGAASFLCLPIVLLVSTVRPLSGDASRREWCRFLLSFAAGLPLTAIAIAPRWGLNLANIVSAAGCLSIASLQAWHWRRDRLLNSSRRDATERDATAPEAGLPQDLPLHRIGLAQVVASIVTGLSVSMAFVAAGRYLDQLAIASWWFDTAQWAALLAGVAMGVGFGSARLRTISRWLATTITCVALAAFPTVVAWNLDLNTYVAGAMWHAIGKMSFATLLCLPLGLLVGSQLAGRRVPLVIAAGGLGFVLTQRAWLTSLGVPSLQGVSVALWLLAALLLEVNWAAWSRAETRSRKALIEPAAACLCIVLMPLVGRNYAPELAAKLLFDSQVSATHRLESRDELLPHFDEGRCLATYESDLGTVTVWRYRGVQTHLRASGIPVSVQSLDTTVCPDSSGEALQAVLPLVLHERPGHVLILGAKSSTAIETSLLFPVQSVTCVEPDRRMFEVVRRHGWQPLAANPTDDDRLQCVVAEPRLALAGRQHLFDVIVSNPDHGAIRHAASTQTAEFYQQAATALSEDGLFCQRLLVGDCGPHAVKLMVQACRNSFQQVATLEVAPGEWLLLAKTSDESLFPSDLVKRLQATHVRSALSRLGWDWATPLELSLIDWNQDGLSTGTSRGLINRAANGRLTAWLPWEVQRWADKPAEMASGLGPWSRTLKVALGAQAETAEVNRRLTELALQRELVHEHPDEFWAYRKAVKRRLQEQPHSEIVQVRGQQPTHQLHPSEQRRLHYFETLGKAAKETTPSPDAVTKVAAYVEPTDPLVSFFARQEVAALASRNRDENAAVELQERLHVAYFTLASDRSVRNVITTIHLLCDQPELMSDATLRGDHLDALIQVLHSRWFNRGDKSPKSTSVTLLDIEKSLTAIDTATTTLDELRSARGLTESQWSARKSAIEKSLVRPLRNYRTSLLPRRTGEEIARDRIGDSAVQ